MRYSSDHIFLTTSELTDGLLHFETAVPSSWVGKTVVELSVRQTYRINILAAATADSWELLPGGGHQFQPDETIYILGEKTRMYKNSSKAEERQWRGPRQHHVRAAPSPYSIPCT